MKKPKLSIVTMGCSKNLVDSERIAFALSNFYEYTSDAQKCDVLIINTCGFIDSAKQQNVQAILEAVHFKKQLGISKIVVMGCLSQRYGDELKEQIAGVDAFFGANNFRDVIAYLVPKGDCRAPLEGSRILMTPFHFAYLKIAEGCNHRCAFCAIPVIRGNHVSVPMEELIDEAAQLKSNGIKELNVIAQDTSFYGTDLYGKKTLAKLLEKLSDMKFDWIRIMYAYPTAFPIDVLEIMADRTNICNYLDIPLQHISDRILKSMLRGISREETIKLVETMRRIVPDIAIRSTFIVGFPGETEAEFSELMAFLRDVRLDRVGAFTYSREEGTPAYNLVDNIKPKTKEIRLDKLMKQQAAISLEKNKAKVGKTLKVLIDECDDKYFYGRTEQDATEVDNRVLIDKTAPIKVGEFFDLEIKKATEFDLFGILPKVSANN